MNYRLIAFLLFLTIKCSAQDIPDYGFNKVRVVEHDRTIQADLSPVTLHATAKSDRLYFWYSGNTIHATQGGFSGTILSGNYSEFYLNKNLKKQGVFVNGLMNSVWKEWNEDGLLLNSFTWKNGIKHGPYFLYNNNGKLIESGSYSSNKLDGPIAYFAGKDSLKTVYYSDGKIINKRSFLQRLNVFKKAN